MNELPCGTVRRWLQAPESLALIDARHMDRHLARCPDCASYWRQQVQLDRLIRHSLDSAVGTSSVRQAVRARILDGQPLPVPRERRFPFPPLRDLLRPASILAPIAIAAAVILALFHPQIFNKHEGVPAAVAAWHLQRPHIGYPMTIDPHRPQHLLVGTAWGQVYQSWNAGRSWQQLGQLPAGLIIRDLAVDTSNPNRYLVAAKHSVYVSDNAGRIWTQTASGLLGAENMFILQDPRRPRNVYLGPSVLWKSADGGRTWHQDGSGTVFAPNGIQSLAVARNGDLYTGIWSGGVAVSHDGGLTWQPRSRGLTPNVVNVSVGPTDRLWAATDQGVFSSTDSGAHWQRLGPSHVFATSVVDKGSYILVGGTGGMYRSNDSGRHWSHAQEGLPLDPYVYSLSPDPTSPNRVYASLNGDGIFRSDDGGQTWKDINAGLPISRQEGKSSLVLFRRHGLLWTTSTNGAEPTDLTIDHTVRPAVFTPDGAAIAYLTGSARSWRVRVVSAGGSLAKTIATGTGPLPTRLLWSPTASRLAIIGATRVMIVSLSGETTTWTTPARSTVLGWTAGGHALLVWDAASRAVWSHDLGSGHTLARWPGTYPSLPVRAPGGSVVAMVEGPGLVVGVIGGSQHVVAQVPGCRPISWSDDGSRLLLACRDGAQIRSATGRLVAHPAVPANTTWVPGSNTTQLYFSHGSLWSWRAATGAHVLVPHASPAG